MVLQWYTKKVKKINKKIIYISLAVLVLILSASAVMATVTPPKGIKDNSLSKVWANIMDLQTQINGLVTRMTAVEAKDTNLRTRINGLDTRMTAVEAKDTNLQTRINGLDARMTAVEAKAPIIKTAESPDNSDDWKIQTAICEEGQKVLGGGGAIGCDYGDKVFIQASYPSQDNRWTVVAGETTPTSSKWVLKTFAICVDV